ncbi:revertant of glycogen synthase kinase mutation [Cordyceps militaris]|uniref:Revertant of glycogen synthase kinase mutation n=1 Tax=Cordyceps militaris TaxID=73501 RepID=A0A2H4SMB1_CORMI|nr:revertant of glycogen synthase kinase mutation [Cordyceps militaris]
MLLLHQVGTVKIGEVIRYTVTYTPSQDRILPSPEKLFVRIRNTAAIALRAAFVHGPYTLSVAAYPSAFRPNEKFPDPHRYGVPEFQPMVKAGGSWECELLVPDDIRQSAGIGGNGSTFGKDAAHNAECASWVIEISSQIMFSTSAAVSYEVVVGRDQKSLNLSQASAVQGSQNMRAGKLTDHQQSIGAKDGHHPAQPQGIFSRAVKLKVEDTATLWNTPRLPGWDDLGEKRAHENKGGADKPVESVAKTGDPETVNDKPVRKQKKVHLVLLTHGLHSNLGADMLYMKESIDAAAKQAKVDAKARRQKEREDAGLPVDAAEDDDDEQVVVRGYSGNATKTEKGIKYLGKRLARYVLAITYPDQPFIPLGKSAGETLIKNFDNEDLLKQHIFKQAHKHSKVSEDTTIRGKDSTRPYTISSISFIGHSLGGLVQTYAVAYIQKHSPKFFDLIRPVNFIALASPFLGLSNENPVYVKFALDFGLVGRTGKDLGLTWRAPTIARNGWGAIVGNLGESAHKTVYGDSQPDSKPLLRILPTGPAHTALKKFRNRTTYSNVVNDGRVEKARRDAGLVETVVGFGWAELTGSSMSTAKVKHQLAVEAGQESGATTPRDNAQQVPQPDEQTMDEDDRASIRSISTPFSEGSQHLESPSALSIQSPLSSLFNLFKSSEPPKPDIMSKKQKKMIRRAQTVMLDSQSKTSSSSTSDVSKSTKATTGHEFEGGEFGGVMAPPKTTFFESAGDLLNPKMPDVDFLVDPSKRPRTIFHDRVYQPSDIPPPPLKRRNTSSLMRKTFKSSQSPKPTESGSSSPYPTINHEDSMASTKDYDDTAHTSPDKQPNEVVDGSGMRVEEKIARGYHKGLAWRKVLVKLEPDAHNNIIVRRMFANAYGWPVMKHMVDVHFSDSVIARMATEDEHLGERALDANQPPDAHGCETKHLSEELAATLIIDDSVAGDEGAGSRDAVPALLLPKSPDSDAHSWLANGGASPVTWSERDWVDSDDNSDAEAAGAEKEVDAVGKGDGTLSPSSWKWATEKIVGKGAVSGRKSPAPEQKQKQA